MFLYMIFGAILSIKPVSVAQSIMDFFLDLYSRIGHDPSSEIVLNIWNFKTSLVYGHLPFVQNTWWFCQETRVMAPQTFSFFRACSHSLTQQWALPDLLNFLTPGNTPFSHFYGTSSTQKAANLDRIPLICFEPSYFKWWLLSLRRLKISECMNWRKDKLILRLNCLLWQSI